MPTSAVLTSLAQMGVSEVCVAAGARNAAIIAALQASTGVRIWSFFEERCAGFFALGRCLAKGEPVAVVTTSGTAAAELLPAIIEAHYQGLPLIAVTADRPPHYRGTGAPQAIEQVGLFGRYVSRCFDITDANAEAVKALAEVSRRNQPLHINVCLEEGVPETVEGVEFGYQEGRDYQVGGAWEATLAEFLKNDDVVVLAAGLSPAEVREVWPFLRDLNVPVIAEATANLRGHPCVIGGGEEMLRALNPSHVLRIGAVPSWRWWRDLEDRPEVAVLSLSRTPYAGLTARPNVAVLPLDHPLPHVPMRPPRQMPDLPPRPPWPALSEHAWMQHLAAVIPAESAVFLGNSLPIREFNEAGGNLDRDAVCYASRGANGIDGLVSTFFGIGAEGDESWIILGDLSALYDLAAPWILKQLPPGNRRIVVINNGGGKIFAKVASLRRLPEASRAMIENRHTLSFAPWAELWNMAYRRATAPEDLRDLPDGPVLIEVIPQS